MSSPDSSPQNTTESLSLLPYKDHPIAYFDRESQISSAQYVAHYQNIMKPYFFTYLPIAMIAGLSVARVSNKFMKQLNARFMGRIPAKWASRIGANFYGSWASAQKGAAQDALTLHNQKLREAQLRAMKRRNPEYDHFVAMAFMPFLIALLYTGWYHQYLKGNYSSTGRMVRDIERERFNVLDEGAYKYFSRD